MIMSRMSFRHLICVTTSKIYNYVTVMFVVDFNITYDLPRLTSKMMAALHDYLYKTHIIHVPWSALP